MMRVEIKKFGEILVSRPAGREAYLAFKAYLSPKDVSEPIELDFSDVKVLGPSWAEEFVGALKREHRGAVVCLPSDNPSIIESLKIIEEGVG